MVDIREQLELVMSGIIPATIKEKTELVIELTDYIKLGPPMAAVIIAEARINYFEGECKPWQEWINENFKLGDSYIYKLLRSGTMMLDVMDNKDLYKQLFELSIDKLSKLSTIKRDMLDEFLKKHDAVNLNIEEFRAAVDKFRGKKPKAKNDKEQMLLPGFDDAVDCIAHLIDNEFDFGHVVKDAAVQEKAIKSGLHLLGAAISYECDKKIPNTKVLMDLKQNFLDTAKGIEQVIAEASPDNMLEA